MDNWISKIENFHFMKSTLIEYISIKLANFACHINIIGRIHFFFLFAMTWQSQSTKTIIEFPFRNLILSVFFFACCQPTSCSVYFVTRKGINGAEFHPWNGQNKNLYILKMSFVNGIAKFFNFFSPPEKCFYSIWSD